MGSTLSGPSFVCASAAGRRAFLAAVLAALSGCAGPRPRLGPTPVPVRDGAFLLPDGARLPFRAWLPDGEPNSVILALHGFGDSRDAWEYAGPAFAASGIALVAPDQRGFGETASRGRWVGADRMTEDAAALLGQLRTLYPDRKLFVLGESMGGAVAMRVATAAPRVDVAGYVLVAPAVWGRASMNVFLRGALWLLSRTLPGVTVTDGGPVRVRASDNIVALRRFSRDPLTLHGARFDTVRGLVDLMDEALAAASDMPFPTLAMYGGRDEVIPPEATAAMWRALPGTARRAYYPGGYHLLLRDLGRKSPLDDIMAWMRDPDPSLPSGADRAAGKWLAEQA